MLDKELTKIGLTLNAKKINILRCNVSRILLLAHLLMCFRKVVVRSGKPGDAESTSKTSTILSCFYNHNEYNTKITVLKDNETLTSIHVPIKFVRNGIT